MLGQLEICRGDELKLQNLGLYLISFLLLPNISIVHELVKIHGAWPPAFELQVNILK